MRRILLGLGVLALSMASSQSLLAANITVADHSFENFFVPQEKWAMEEAPIDVFNDNGTWYKTHWWALPIPASGSVFGWKFTGWDPSNLVSNWKGIIRNDGQYTGSIDGNQLCFLGSGVNMGIYQDLSNALAANTTYTLKVGVGDNNGDLQLGSSLTAVFSSFDGSVETVLATNNIAYDGVHTPVMNDLVVSYTTGAVAPTGNIRLRFFGGANTTTFNQGDWNIDNVRLDASTTVPEPASLLAMLGGLSSLGLCFRRKRA